MAAFSMGKIADTQDLEWFISRIKEDPNVRIDMSQFGGAVHR